MSFKLYEKEVEPRGNLLCRKWLAKRFDLERPVAWRRSIYRAGRSWTHGAATAGIVPPDRGLRQ